MSYTRLITCGDSFTEGMTDELVDGHYRGWADRVADVMATAEATFTYANLAIRGKLVRQVVAEQLPIGLDFVTGPETLFIFHAGANDVLRPNYKSDEVLPLYADAVRRIAESGATILLFTVLEKTANEGKAGKVWAARFGEFNANVRAVAKEVGAIVADANEDGFLSDRRFLAKDRLHLNALGHYRVAQGVLEKIGLPFDALWRVPLVPAPRKSRWAQSYEYLEWFITYLLPWIIRRLRGKSSGDGRSAKYPNPIPWPIAR
ncbi:MAG: SGNH/GDSL hydrolase family protein [Actinobacteria bacterium]|nr:SGNH/GDSL hydrolase family protein [Actinomycetota bacterium]